VDRQNLEIDQTMNAKNTNVQMLKALLLGLMVAVNPVGRGESAETGPKTEASESAFARHLLANCPTNVTVTDVSWRVNGSKVEFTAKVSFEAPRFVRASFFPVNCSKQLAQLREAVLVAKQPIEFQKEEIHVGEERVINGSFSRRIDGMLAGVVWGDALLKTQPSDAGLPLENSPYSQMMRDKIQEVKTHQAAESVGDFVATIGKLSSTAAALTGNGNLAQVSRVADVLTGTSSANTNSAAPTMNNPVPALGNGSVPITKVFEQGVTVFRRLGGAGQTK
jgi:hypothetical protein